MCTPSSLPWIIRCSMRLYRWFLFLGPPDYRREYGDLTLQLFRECCLDAYQQQGTLGVLALWFPLFSNAVVEMLAERISAQQPAARMQLAYPANLLFEQRLRYWRTMAPLPLYESGIDTNVLPGIASAFLKSTVADDNATSVDTEMLATLRQTIQAADYRGKQLRFSGDIKVERVEQQAGLWIEAIVESLPHRRNERLKPENVARGTLGWLRYEETLAVPADARTIRFGFVLHGKGQIWLTNARLEVVDEAKLTFAP